MWENASIATNKIETFCFSSVSYNVDIDLKKNNRIVKNITTSMRVKVMKPSSLSLKKKKYASTILIHVLLNTGTDGHLHWYTSFTEHSSPVYFYIK